MAVTAGAATAPDHARPRSFWANQFIADYIRPFAVAIWAAAFITEILVNGIPTEREQLIFWFAVGLFTAVLGVRNPFMVLVDWLPFALFLLAYDYSRGAADRVGLPLHWTPQIDVDKWMFGGTVPTDWLQQHFKQRDVQWWEAIVGLCYTSHFIVPYAMCAWYWFRDRHLFHRFAGRFLALSFVGVAGYILFPAAPPWAASRCTAAEVANQHQLPSCIGRLVPPSHALIPGFIPDHAGADPFLERITTRGYEVINMKFAGDWLAKGQGTVNFVAAVPSLHGAVSVLILLFCWRRVPWWWRPVIALYPLVMMFTLVYGGEHYVADVLLGWLCAAVVCLLASRIEKRLGRRAQSRTLTQPTDRQPDGETPCPQTATTSSSPSASDEASSSPPATSTAVPDPRGTMARSE
jgi:membrane-associated phospholipid phosphatase